MITITDKPTKVLVASSDGNFMDSIIFKSQLNRISHNRADDFIILYFSNDRLIISYLHITPSQRSELNINSNEDLFNYFDSIT